MEIIFNSHANKAHFHKKGYAPSLSLKGRVFGTPEWPITSQINASVAVCPNDLIAAYNNKA